MERKSIVFDNIFIHFGSFVRCHLDIFDSVRDEAFLSKKKQSPHRLIIWSTAEEYGYEGESVDGSRCGCEYECQQLHGWGRGGTLTLKTP